MAIKKYKAGKEPGYNKKVFDKLAKRVYKQLKSKNIDPPPTWNQTQKYVSEYVYPKFKGQLLSKIKNSYIDNTLEVRLQQTKNEVDLSQIPEDLKPKLDLCGNVFKVPNEDLLSMEWWEISSTLSVLPENIQVKYNAGVFGSTEINKVGQTDYHLSGLSAIVENIRKDVDNGSGPSWNGFRKLVPGEKDDMNNCSYYIEFVLEGAEIGMEIDEFLVDDFEMTDEEIEKRKETLKNIKKITQQRKKQISEAKSKRAKLKKAKTRKRPIEKPIEETVTKTVFDLDTQLKQLYDEYKEGIWDAKEYKREKNRLIKLAEKINSKK